MTQEEIIMKEDEAIALIKRIMWDNVKLYHSWFGGIVVNTVRWCFGLGWKFELKMIEKDGTLIVDLEDFLGNVSLTPYTGRGGFTPIENYKPKKKNGDPFEIGDKVWFIIGRGIEKGVVEINSKEGKCFPLVVRGENGHKNIFTISGKFVESGDVVLFHQKPVISFED
jgi:hypothetical protein